MTGHYPTAEHARLASEGMYRPKFESNACGVGLVAATDGKPSQRVVSLIEAHHRTTDSKWSETILRDWDRWQTRFWQVCPKEMVRRLKHRLSDSKAIEAVERVKVSRRKIASS